MISNSTTNIIFNRIMQFDRYKYDDFFYLDPQCDGV